MSSLSCYRPRFLFLLTTLCLVVQMAMIHPTWAGGAGPCEDYPACVDQGLSICQGGSSAGLECFVDSDCPSSKCIETTFRPDLPRVCSNDKGRTCSSNNECVRNGKCLIDFKEDAPLVQATLTFIVDDNEADNDQEHPPRGAATILLEVENDGRRSLLAQTHVAIPHPLDDLTDPEVEFLRTEAGLNEAVVGVDVPLLDRLLFRDSRVSQNPEGQESGRELRVALLKIFYPKEDPDKLPIRPVIVGTPERIRPIDYTDHEADGVASVVRLKVLIRFVRIDTN
jgi:hypothetical protein